MAKLLLPSLTGVHFLSSGFIWHSSWVECFGTMLTAYNQVFGHSVVNWYNTLLINCAYFKTAHVLHRKFSLCRVLCRIYSLGEKSQVAEGDKLPRGAGGMPPPRNFFEMNNFMRWDAIWYILRHNCEKCYCVCIDLISSGWFSDIVTYILWW